MKVSYVKFLTESDRARAFQELSSFSEVIGLETDIYCISLAGLRLLDECRICYTVASDDEVRTSRGRAWRFAWRGGHIEGIRKAPDTDSPATMARAHAAKNR